MSLIAATIEAPVVESSATTLDTTPVTYGLLRQVLLDCGSIELREAQKMDRAIRSLLCA